MRAFIIRPFGTKEGINFDNVETRLIDPALSHFDIEGRTTGEILEAGNIRVDMFQLLLVADIVIADISIHNPNVYYELGIRHALRDRHTYLIRAKAVGSDPKDVPFDLKTDRYLEYDSADPAACLPRLIDGLKQTLANNRQDSPVFVSLPELIAQDPSHFLPVPAPFREEVEYAAETNDPGKLALLGFEVRGLPWESTGLRLVGRAQFNGEYFSTAKMTWEAVRELDADDPEANHLLGTIYQRLADLPRSNIALDRVISQRTLNRSMRAEALALLARNTKQMWLDSWRHAPSDNQRAEALRSPLLMETHEKYERAFAQDLNDAYYPGLNALAMLMIILELARQMPDIFAERFETDDAMQRQLSAYQVRVQQLTGVLQVCIEANKARHEENEDEDLWLQVTEADLLLLTAKKPGTVYTAYRGLAERMDPLSRGSVWRQLKVYEELGMFPEKIQKALEALQPPHGITIPEQLDRLILFSGHRIDPPGRAQRFPANCEAKAREAIFRAIQEEKSLASGPVAGFSGGASGGDILFHEVCAELSIPTRLFLALPVDKYLAASVDPAGPEWTRRFYAIQRAVPAKVLADEDSLPSWLHLRTDYDTFQRSNLWLLSHAFATNARSMTLVVLWNGEAGDGPGGTEQMLQLAKEHAVRTVILDTRKLFDLR